MTAETTSRSRPCRCIGAIGLALVLGACGSPGTGGREGGPVPASFQRPWPGGFDQSAVLLADEIHVEGPEGLLEHVVVRQDPWNLELEIKTVPAGLRQVTSVKQGRSAPIRGQLDALELVATHRLVVLTRPGNVPLLVRARGNAFWSTSDESASKRGDSLELRQGRPR